MNSTFTFQDPWAVRLELSGGKGSNLALLTQWGFPVPPGFIVTAQAYRDFIAAGGETQAKHANKLRVETKTYVMQDYDLVNFRFSK